MGSCRRRLSWCCTSVSFARMRFLIVMRLTQNRPFRDLAQMCVNPRKSDVSGLPSLRRQRSITARWPNSTRRVLSGCSSNPNPVNR